MQSSCLKLEFSHFHQDKMVSGYLLSVLGMFLSPQALQTVKT